MQKVTAGVIHEGVEVNITIEVINDNDGRIRNDALDRIHSVALREAQRFAEISVVDLQDQATEIEEAKRIAQLPADRPHVAVVAGTKDPESATVLKGSYELGGGDHPKRTVSAQGSQPSTKKGAR